MRRRPVTGKTLAGGVARLAAPKILSANENERTSEISIPSKLGISICTWNFTTAKPQQQKRLNLDPMR